MKKIFALFYTVCIVLVFCSCSDTVINSDFDEIRLHKWQYTNEYGLQADISFEENKISLSIENNNEKTELNGLCLCDSESLIIIDNNTNCEYLFYYELNGDDLNLTYHSKSIKFIKSD